ncbi:flagellar biosynthesis regulator FlaF [Rhodovulum imhoffii]|nr:flagellar biosynthesis regulator FlaF [Rhodovulum imhoffii]
MAKSAYAAPQIVLSTARGTEYRVISRITARMAEAGKHGTQSWPRLVAALHDNHRLWTALAIDLASPGNKLPEALRAEILSLADFSLRHTGAVLARKAEIAPLIEINTAILRGLAKTEQTA